MTTFRTILFTALLAMGLFVPATAMAQSGGTCNCNMGCHARPGQCVTSDNCATGYAPFCGVRADSCPQAGWVSCNGDCMCVAIPGFDAGVIDASSSDVQPGQDVQSQDVQGTDVQPGQDVQGTDVQPGQDVQGTDVQPGQDVQGTDVQGSDVQGSDVQPGQDVQGTDAQGQDVPPVCTHGVVVDGVCYSTNCMYDPEVGFYCAGSGYECRSIDGMAWCIPICAAKTCPSGQVCDTTLGCVPDMCSMIACSTGEVCVANRCVAANDGGALDGSVTGDGGRMDGSANAGDGSNRADGGGPGSETDPGRNMGGCGCRTTGGTGRGGAAMALLGVAALVARRRRTRRN